MWYNRIIFLIMYWLVGAILFYRMYCNYSVSTKRQSFLCERFCWCSVHHCHRLTYVGISWDSTMFLPRSKIWLFFLWGKQYFLAIISHVYLDYGIICRYQLLCEAQYKLLSMSVTFRVCHNAHNPSIKYWSNGQTLGFGGMRSALNHSEIVYYPEKWGTSLIFYFLLK